MTNFFLCFFLFPYMHFSFSMYRCLDGRSDFATDASGDYTSPEIRRFYCPVPSNQKTCVAECQYCAGAVYKYESRCWEASRAVCKQQITDTALRIFCSETNTCVDGCASCTGKTAVQEVLGTGTDEDGEKWCVSASGETCQSSGDYFCVETGSCVSSCEGNCFGFDDESDATFECVQVRIFLLLFSCFYV